MLYLNSITNLRMNSQIGALDSKFIWNNPNASVYQLVIADTESNCRFIYDKNKKYNFIYGLNPNEICRVVTPVECDSLSYIDSTDLQHPRSIDDKPVTNEAKKGRGNNDIGHVISNKGVESAKFNHDTLYKTDKNNYILFGKGSYIKHFMQKGTSIEMSYGIYTILNVLDGIITAYPEAFNQKTIKFVTAVDVSDKGKPRGYSVLTINLLPEFREFYARIKG